MAKKRAQTEPDESEDEKRADAEGGDEADGVLVPLLMHPETGEGPFLDEVAKVLVYRIVDGGDGAAPKMVHSVTLTSEPELTMPVEKFFALRGGGVFDAVGYGKPPNGKIIARVRHRSELPPKAPGGAGAFNANVFELPSGMVGIPDLPPWAMMMFAWMQAQLSQQLATNQQHEERLASIAIAAVGRPTTGDPLMAFLLEEFKGRSRDAVDARRDKETIQERLRAEVEKLKKEGKGSAMLEQLTSALLTGDNVNIALKLLASLTGNDKLLGDGAAAPAAPAAG
jgi:hypothetical protein